MPQPRGRSILILVVVWIAGSVGACGVGLALMTWSAHRADEAREAVAPLVVIEDEELRFRLRRPSPSWRLLPREEAAAINSGAEALALHATSGGGGIVLVEPAYGVDLRRAAETVIAGYAQTGYELGEPVAVTVSGRDALRSSGHGTLTDRPVRAELLVLVSEDHIYQLFGWWPELADEPEALTTELITALEIVDGPVVDRSRRVAPADIDAPLSRVRSGAFESAAYGLWVGGGNGWTALTGAELARSDSLAEAGLAREGPEVFLVVRASTAPGADPEQWRQRTRDFALMEVGPRTDETHTVAGSPVSFARYRIEEGIPTDHAHGVLVAGDRYFEITAWSAAPGALDAHLDLALARIELLTDGERDAIEAECPGTLVDRVTDGVALRRGRFRGYPWGLGWGFPSSCWRAHIGDEADAQEAGALFFAECPRRAVRAALWVEPREDLDPAVLHAFAIVDVFGAEPDAPPEEIAIGDARGLASRGEYESDGARIAYELRTVALEEELVTWAVWYPIAAGEDAAREARSALEAMRVDADADPEITSEPGFFQDRRLGFAIEDRASGVRFEDTTSASTPLARGIGGRASRVRVDAYAVHTQGTRVDDLALDTVRARVGRGSGLFQPEETTGTLGGEPCQVLRWVEGGRRYAQYSVTRGSVLYGVITDSPLFGGDEERWARAFRFVDP